MKVSNSAILFGVFTGLVILIYLFTEKGVYGYFFSYGHNSGYGKLIGNKSIKNTNIISSKDSV